MSIAEVAAAKVTPEEFERLPDNEQYELVDGHLVERREMGTEAAYVGKRVATQLDLFERENGGVAFGDGTPFKAFGPDGRDVRKPDAAYVAPGRLVVLPEGNCDLAPDLAVEVVSPSDNVYKVNRKIRQYLEGGVRAVWLITPPSRQVREIRLDSDRTFRPGDTLVCEDILPGFAVPVDSLFPKLPVDRMEIDLSEDD